MFIQLQVFHFFKTLLIAAFLTDKREQKQPPSALYLTYCLKQVIHGQDLECASELNKYILRSPKTFLSETLEKSQICSPEDEPKVWC